MVSAYKRHQRVMPAAFSTVIHSITVFLTTFHNGHSCSKVFRLIWTTHRYLTTHLSFFLLYNVLHSQQADNEQNLILYFCIREHLEPNTRWLKVSSSGKGTPKRTRKSYRVFSRFLSCRISKLRNEVEPQPNTSKFAELLLIVSSLYVLTSHVLCMSNYFFFPLSSMHKCFTIFLWVLLRRLFSNVLWTLHKFNIDRVFYLKNCRKVTPRPIYPSLA